MSLNDAYDLVQKGENLIAKKQFKDASVLYKEASELFSKQLDATDNEEINNALRILVDSHARRSKELSVMQNRKPQIKAQPLSPAQSSPQNKARGKESGNNDGIAASLASARGLDNLVGGGGAEDGNDPLTKFQVQVYNLIKINPPTAQDQDIDISNTKIKPSGKSIEELELENATLKQLLASYSESLHTYESFHKKLKLNLKNYLNALKSDLQVQERRKKAQYDQKIDALTRDNRSLESQVKKLKERWNDLVESARRRREDTNQERKE